MARVSGYINGKQRDYYKGQKKLVAKVDNLRNVSFGLLLARIAEFGLKLDLASLKKYQQTHGNHTQAPAEPPAEPKHTRRKRKSVK